MIEHRQNQLAEHRGGKMNEAKELNTAANIALLAPVPAEHLESALKLLKTKEQGRIREHEFPSFS